MSRTPSPADQRCNLNPDVVDALADQLHTLNCTPLIGAAAKFTPQHRDNDLAQARFLLQGLRGTGWELTRAPKPDGEQPHRCALLVALNEDDAKYWRHAGGTRRAALTHGNSPLRSVEGLRVTDVYITPRAAEGERYERIMGTVHRSLRLMNVDPSTAINYLHEQPEGGQ
ncbi:MULTISPECIES: hypothetical protein [unclassified Micromonospora]|uniref:hypothetical protein n=1 Tax=unclassified Micromonospora TaxID=2617518 RepID=UPI00332B3BE9